MELFLTVCILDAYLFWTFDAYFFWTKFEINNGSTMRMARVFVEQVWTNVRDGIGSLVSVTYRTIGVCVNNLTFLMYLRVVIQSCSVDIYYRTLTSILDTVPCDDLIVTVVVHWTLLQLFFIQMYTYQNVLHMISHFNPLLYYWWWWYKSRFDLLTDWLSLLESHRRVSFNIFHVIK